MTDEQQVKLCSECEFCKKIDVHWYGKTFLGCYANGYHGKWVAEIERCPIGKGGGSTPIVRCRPFGNWCTYLCIESWWRND